MPVSAREVRILITMEHDSEEVRIADKEVETGIKKKRD